MDDTELLQEFASRRSEEAFRTLVDRHIHFVYGIALRQLGDAHAAEEVTQTVFIDLATKAATLSSQTVLAGWLFRAARFAASKSLRTELRRHRREREAVAMEPILHSPIVDSPWEQMEPLLNEALEELSEPDRGAVLLRFFEKKPLREVGASLGLNEEAAKKRVARAVEKLRLIFHRRGVVIPSAVLLGVLTTQVTPAASAELAASVTSAAILHSATAASTSTASSVTVGKGILKLMALSKLKTVVLATSALLLVGGATQLVLQQERPAPATVPAVPAPEAPGAKSVDDEDILRIIRSMNVRALEAAPPRVFLRASEGSEGPGGLMIFNGKMMGRDVTLREILAAAYGTSASRIQPAPSAPALDSHYDFLVSLPSRQGEGLQETLRQQLGLTAHREVRSLDIYQLKARSGEFDGLRPSVADGGRTTVNNANGQLTFANVPIEAFVKELEQLMGRPIIDESGLKGHYDIFLTWNETGKQKPDAAAVRKTVSEQLGLDLTGEKRELPVWVVEGVKSK